MWLVVCEGHYGIVFLFCTQISYGDLLSCCIIPLSHSYRLWMSGMV